MSGKLGRCLRENWEICLLVVGLSILILASVTSLSQTSSGSILRESLCLKLSSPNAQPGNYRFPNSIDHCSNVSISDQLSECWFVGRCGISHRL